MSQKKIEKHVKYVIQPKSNKQTKSKELHLEPFHVFSVSTHTFLWGGHLGLHVKTLHLFQDLKGLNPQSFAAHESIEADVVYLHPQCAHLLWQTKWCFWTGVSKLIIGGLGIEKWWKMELYVEFSDWRWWGNGRVKVVRVLCCLRAVRATRRLKLNVSCVWLW